MIAVLLSLPFFLAGLATLLPDLCLAVVREGVVAVLFVFVVVGYVSFALLSLLRPALAVEFQKRVST